MTKSKLWYLQNAHTTLFAIHEGPGTSDFLKGLLSSAHDELGMVILHMEKHPEDFAHPFWNDDLGETLEKGNMEKDHDYTADRERATNGDYVMTIMDDTLGEPLLDFENYIDPKHIEEDIAELRKLNYKIKALWE